MILHAGRIFVNGAVVGRSVGSNEGATEGSLEGLVDGLCEKGGQHASLQVVGSVELPVQMHPYTTSRRDILEEQRPEHFS